METKHADRAPKAGQNRRTHAESLIPGIGRCGARITAVVSARASADDVTCLACRARLREARS